MVFFDNLSGIFDNFNSFFSNFFLPKKSGFFGPEPSKFGPFGLFLKSRPDRAFLAKKAGPSGFILGLAKPDPSLVEVHVLTVSD